MAEGNGQCYARLAKTHPNLTMLRPRLRYG